MRMRLWLAGRRGPSGCGSVACSLPMFTSFKSIRRGTPVKVYMGAEWTKGTVHSTMAGAVAVQIAKRIVTIYDLRNIKPL